jgi:hypothetical protein
MRLGSTCTPSGGFKARIIPLFNFGTAEQAAEKLGIWRRKLATFSPRHVLYWSGKGTASSRAWTGESVARHGSAG